MTVLLDPLTNDRDAPHIPKDAIRTIISPLATQVWAAFLSSSNIATQPRMTYSAKGAVTISNRRISLPKLFRNPSPCASRRKARHSTFLRAIRWGIEGILHEKHAVARHSP